MMPSAVKKVGPFPKGEVLEFIAGSLKTLEDGLELMGEGLQTRVEKHGDLLGVAADRRLVLVHVLERQTQGTLSMILHSLDWTWENMGTVCRLYPEIRIDKNQFPRTILFTPSYSSSFIKNISYLNYRVKVDLFTYSCLEGKEGRYILLEPVEKRSRNISPSRSDEKIFFNQPNTGAVKITTEEIMAFLT